MTTMERLFEMYIEDKNEQHETGAVYEAMKEYRRTLRECDGDMQSRLQAELWDCFVMYGDSREKDGFMAGFRMAMNIIRENGGGKEWQTR